MLSASSPASGRRHGDLRVRREAAEQLVSETTQASVEAKAVSDRLRNAIRLYHERLTGIVEPKDPK